MKKYGIITAPDCMIMEEPRRDCTISDEFFSGWLLSYEDEPAENGFVEITTHYGYKGYIHTSEFREITIDEVRAHMDKKRFQRLNRPATDIGDGPSVQAVLLETLPKNAIVEVIEPGEKYTVIRAADGTQGYVHSVFLSERKEDDSFFLGTDFDKQEGCLAALADEAEFRKNVVESAMRYMGTQYRWGGKSAAGLDCSGLVFMSYFENGVLIWRDAKLVENYPLHNIEQDELQPGDLIFFPGHVALYIGGNRYIHSTGYAADSGVTINSLCPSDPDCRQDLVPKVEGCASIFAPDVKKRYNRRLQDLPGNISFYYKNLDTGKVISYREGEDHIAASVIKMFLMAALYEGFESGRLSPDDTIPVPAEAKVPSCGVLTYTKDVTELSVRDLITLMIIVSDNTAANLLFDYAGGAERINAFIASVGIENCTFNRKMFDSEAAARGIENHITAEGCARLLEMIYRGELVSEEASGAMLQTLSDQRLNGKIPFLLNSIRPKFMIAHKTGEDGGVTHDVGIIEGSRAPFVIVFLGNDTDTAAYEQIMAKTAMELYVGDVI